MSGFSFLNAALLAGTVAVAVPIAIHLLNRSRHRVVDWAAMEFLFAAHRRSRRRVKMEHWLIMLLRCLAVLLLVALVARPTLTPRSAASGPATLNQTTEHVIVLDDSPSMDARSALQTPLDAARGQIRDWIEHLARNRPSDTVTIITTSKPEEPLCRNFSPAAQGQGRLDSALESLKTVDSQKDFARVVAAIRPGAEDGKSSRARAVYWLTDLRASDWQASAGEQNQPSAELGALARDAALVAVVDCGTAGPRNCAVTAVQPASPAIVTDIPADYRVSVRNFGEEAVENAVVSFGIKDGVKHMTSIKHIAPGETETVLCRITPDDSGWLPVEATIEEDDLPADNTARFASTVAPAIRVLSVDGNPGALHGRGADYFVRMALTPPGPVRLGYRTTRIRAAELDSINLSEFDTVILSDVPNPSPAQTNDIERWVAEGGGLICFAGAHTDADSWNISLYREGAGPLPARMERIAQPERADTWATMSVADPGHPLVRIFSGDANPFLERIQVRRWWRTTAQPEQGVLCRLNNPDASPVILEKHCGKGVTFLITMAADDSWANWVSDPSFVVVMQQMAILARKDSDRAGSLRAGQPIVEPIDLAVYEPDVRVRTPEEGSPRTVALTPSAAAGAMLLRFENTAKQGWYAVTLTRRDGGVENRQYAVNAGAGESDLRRADERTLRKTLEDARVSLVKRIADAVGGARVARTELWKPVAWLLIAVLAIEHAMSWRFLRKRTE